MAKIKLYPNPLDHEEVKNCDADTIREALTYFKIEHDPLCVVINDVCPDEIDLDLKLKDDDLVKIMNIVEGSASDWATVVDIVTAVAVIAMAATGVGALAIAGVAIAGALISGAIRKGIQPPKFKDATPEELAVGTNANSLTQATNQVRQLQPIPIPVGNIQFAPDVYTYPLVTRVPDDDVLYSVQTFNLGLGDFEVYKRAIGKREYDEEGWGDFAFQELQFRIEYKKDINHRFRTYNYGPYTLSTFGVFPDVNPKGEAQFSNRVPGDIGPVLPSDPSDHAWIYFEGQKGQNYFKFELEGSLYSLDNGEYGANWVVVQIQTKKSSDSEWSEYLSPITVINDSAQIYSRTFGVTVDVDDNETLMIRIRKTRNDELDNTTKLVARMNIVRSYFARDGERTYEDENGLIQYLSPDKDAEYRLPLNIEGLKISGRINQDATTNNYTVAIRAKCYYWDESLKDWVWGHTRNPAWWFLYFARGGFLNKNSNGSEQSFPFSPTNCWQNYAGHPGNEELIWGGGYTHDQIDIERIKEWALFCDREGFGIDLVIRDETSVSDVLEKIANTGRASVHYENGLLGVVFEDPEQIPVAMFGMANIEAGSFTASYNMSDLPTKIRCFFSDRDDDFELTFVEADVPFADQSRLKVVEITLVGVTDKDIAQRECNLLAARQYFQTRTYSWTTDHEGFIAKRGDLVYLAHDSVQFGTSGRVHKFIVKEGRVVGIESTSIPEQDGWIMVRSPNGNMKKYRYEVKDKKIIFLDNYSLIDAPYFLVERKRDGINEQSRFRNSIAEDFIFIADVKSTVGKLVRIASVEASEGNRFTYSAFDEDQALWAYEKGQTIEGTSFNDSTSSVWARNVGYVDKGDHVTIYWDGSDATLFMVINAETNQPFDLNGSFSTGEKEVKLTLDRKKQYTIKIVPMNLISGIGNASSEVKFWLP